MSRTAAVLVFVGFALLSAAMLWWGLTRTRRDPTDHWARYTVSYAAPALVGSVLMVVLGLTVFAKT